MITNNYQNQLNYGAVKDVVPKNVNDKLPQNIQNFDAKNVMENTTIAKTAKNSETDPLTLGLTGAIWLGLAQGCQFLNNKLNADWENSWLGKVGKTFDKLGRKTAKSGSGGLKNKINGLFDKSKILRSLKTPTRAQNSMAASQARGITGFVMSDVGSLLESHLKNGHGDDIAKLANGLEPNLKFSAAEGEKALGYIKNLFENCEDNMPQIKKLINRMSASDAKITVNNIIDGKIPLTKINFKIPNIPFLKRKGSFKEMANKLNAVFDDTALAKQATNLGKKAPKQVLKTLEGLTNGGAGGKLMIVIQASLFAKAIKKSIDAPKGEKLSTFTENIANDFGYFLSIPWQVKSSHMVGGLKYIGIGGAKNAQEQVKNVAKYRDKIKSLNDDVLKGTISRIEYKQRAKEIKNFLKGDSKWYHKPLKAIGKLFSTGLNAETIKPYVDKNSKSLSTTVFNKARNIINKIKGPGIGTVLRFGIGMFVVGPLIAKGITKISHLIFGRPSNSILDEDKDKNKDKNVENNPNNPNFNISEEELSQKLLNNPELMQQLQANPELLNALLNNPQLFMKVLNGEVKVNDLIKKANEELLNSKYIIKPDKQQNNVTTQNPNTPQAPQANPIEGQKSGLNTINDESKSKADLFGLGKKDEEKAAEQTTQEQDPLEPKRTYIPSSECTIGKTQDSQTQTLDPKVNDALLKAQRAEERALAQLGGI